MKRKRILAVAGALLTFLLVVTQAGASSGLPAEPFRQDEYGSKAVRLGEDITLRTENAKAYTLSDGSLEYAIYSGPIHYKDSAGALQDIDTSIVPLAQTKKANLSAMQDADILTNGGNAWDAFFGNNAVEIVHQGQRMSMRYLGDGMRRQAAIPQAYEKALSESSSDERNVNAVTYTAADRVALVYQLGQNTLKETIVIEDGSKAAFSYLLQAPGMTHVERADGIAFLNKETGKDAFVIPRMYMFDSSGSGLRSFDVSYTLTQTPEGLLFSVLPDPAYLASPDRVYPVYIDPTFLISQGGSDTMVSSAYPTSNYYSSPFMIAGRYPGGGTCYGLLSFYLPFLYSATMQDAYIVLAQTTASGMGNYVDLYANNNGFGPYTTFSTRPSFYMNAPYTLHQYVGFGSTASFNVSAIVARWYDGTIPNYGVTIDIPGGYIEFKSFEFSVFDLKPKLVVFLTPTYREKTLKVMSHNVSTAQTIAAPTLNAFQYAYNCRLVTAYQNTPAAMNDVCTLSQPNADCPAVCKSSVYHKHADRLLSLVNSIGQSNYNAIITDNVLYSTQYGAVGGLSYTGRSGVTSVGVMAGSEWGYMDGAQKRFAHELSHNFGAPDHAQVTPDPCIMSGSFDRDTAIPNDMWCADCHDHMLWFFQ